MHTIQLTLDHVGENGEVLSGMEDGVVVSDESSVELCGGFIKESFKHHTTAFLVFPCCFSKFWEQHIVEHVRERTVTEIVAESGDGDEEFKTVESVDISETHLEVVVSVCRSDGVEISPCEVSNAETVLEARVICAVEDELRCTQLLDISQSLELRRVHETPDRFRKLDEFVNRIAYATELVFYAIKKSSAEVVTAAVALRR